MFENMMGWLESLAGNSSLYLLVFFVFCFLAAVILPIPVELGLLGLIAADFTLYGLSIYPSYLIAALVMGLGKAAGAWVVFALGVKIENSLRFYLKWKWFQWLMDKMTILVTKLGYIGLYFILMIPGMPDTIPIYIFSFSNREGDVLENRFFAGTNLLAGIGRTMMIGIIAMSGLAYFA